MCLLVGGKQCNGTLILDGKCNGNRGGYDCALEFLAKYGASAMPQHCTCRDTPSSKRLCSCVIFCA